MPVTPNTFVAGFANPVAFILAQASPKPSVTINITGWTGSEEIMALDVTHSGTSGNHARIAGLLDWNANVTGNLDTGLFLSTAPAGTTPDTPGIRAGVKGVMLFQLGASQTVNPPAATGFTVGCLITKVNWASPVNGIVSYNFDVAMDWISRQQNPTATPPVFTLAYPA
jgi:hypothetical protein